MHIASVTAVRKLGSDRRRSGLAQEAVNPSTQERHQGQTLWGIEAIEGLQMSDEVDATFDASPELGESTESQPTIAGQAAQTCLGRRLDFGRRHRCACSMS
jgi:hypothetical protein